MNDQINAQEVQIDRLVSSTHTYGGLSYGNIASMGSAEQVSNPLEALLEGLNKMRVVAELGIPQLILPPQFRPRLDFLRKVGFYGNDQAIVEAAAKHPALLRAAFSSSAMWMANSATVAPSCDTVTKAVHFTPANLLRYPHRSLETETTARELAYLFPARHGFMHHAPLLSSDAFSDEGAANHTIFTSKHGVKGIHLFVYGRSFYEKTYAGHFPARQTKEAAQAIARLHQLDPECVLFWQQSAQAIEAGVFHNDVISVGEENLFLYHQQAFVDTEECIKQLQALASKLGIPLQCICVQADELSLDEAARSYLFNSQIVRLPEGGRLLLASQEAMEIERSRQVLDKLSEKVPDLRAIQWVPLRQSMRNGGGPACLRLRVVLTETERQHVHMHTWWTPQLHDKLIAWGKRHYRSALHPKDLVDPELREEAIRAHKEIYEILHWQE